MATKKAAAKKTAVKSPAKKTAQKKNASRGSAPEKPAAKTAAKKTTAKKTAAKKTAAKKTAAKQTVITKSAFKKTAAKKDAAKTGAKNTTATKSAAAKPPSKRAGSLPKEGKDPRGGLTAVGRKFFNEQTGGHLKPGVKGAADTPEKKKRKGSFLTRHFTTPPGPVVRDGEPTRQALQAAAWGEPVPQNERDEQKLAAKGRKLLEESKKPN